MGETENHEEQLQEVAKENIVLSYDTNLNGFLSKDTPLMSKDNPQVKKTRLHEIRTFYVRII